ncbi:hypothetical protein FOZ62_005721 [Perkinsus olseni]|uniref:Thymidylate kinase n=1 Tax=Perkinsus olseni TaxID=32597 RepID=A0A7J6QZD0_PEROL|nr:hypothetical protein FOZ62_005721 [Perkinsus olseni]
MARGAFIVLEGLDRSGKSTQLRRISEALRQRTGKEVVEMGFPRRNSGSIGKMLDTYLRDPSYSMRDEAVHLLFSANRWEAMSEMLSHLAAGKHIVCDRYIFSGVAYTAMKGTVDFEWCKSVDVGLPKPDMVVFLDLSPEAAARRGAYGEERYEKKEVQVKVRRMYTRFEKEPFWQIFDADKPAEEVVEYVNKFSYVIIQVTRKVTDAAIAVAEELEKDSIMSIDKIWWPKETNLEGVEFQLLDLSPGDGASGVFLQVKGGGEAASVEPARKRRAELLASLAKRRRVESTSESKPRGVGPSTLVMNIRQQLDILDMNLEKNNGLVDFHQQQVSRYYHEVNHWERRLNAVEKEIKELLEKRMKAGKIKKYQADFARAIPPISAEMASSLLLSPWRRKMISVELEERSKRAVITVPARFDFTGPVGCEVTRRRSCVLS